MQQTCAHCSAEFPILTTDLKFYDQVSPIFSGKKYQISPPTLCPECREKRRMAWRNERFIYQSTCGLCRKKIISMYSPDKPYTSYCQKCFWSDHWNALEYGRDFDFRRPFFEQFQELLTATPLLALINTQTENSEYCHRIYDGRNNYLSFIALYDPENLYYTYYTMTCKDSVDIAVSQYSEWCYDIVDAEHCYNCAYGVRIRNCQDSYFLEDCSGCFNCFGCKNLRQKKYCIFNEQKTQQEYANFLETCDFSSWLWVQKMRQKVQKFFLTLPNRPVLNINAENVTGAYIFNSRECRQTFDIYESERLAYSSQIERSHDCMDCYGMGASSFNYEGVTLGQPSTHLNFCAAVLNGCSDLQYCYDCYANSTDCFGSVGLKKKRYCILNKQYTKEEYETLVPRIIEHMVKTPLQEGDPSTSSGSQQSCEWGEFFPMELSPFAYNETVAQEYAQITKAEVLEKRLFWKEEEKFDSTGITKKIPAKKLPDKTSDIPDDIFNWAITCAESGRSFKIQKAELEFYRALHLPIPRLHPDVRHRKRMEKRNPRKLWQRKCEKCDRVTQTTYAPERSERVYCEKCYLAEVY